MEYLLLDFFLLLSCLGLFYVLRGRIRLPAKGHAKKLNLVLPVMALFTLISLLFLAGFNLRITLGQHQQPVEAWVADTATPAISESPAFTLPASADIGKNVLPNINDPEAVDPQKVCSGYRASNLHETESGFAADLDLAGPACNVYGNDVEHLSLSIEFQGANRVHVGIQPRYIGANNETWFLLPEELVPQPSSEHGRHVEAYNLAVSWSNDPSFWFSVKRVDTGDVLFSTEGKVLVYEDQFIEFASSLPQNYNLYGLGEVIHGFRLGTNLTSKFAPPPQLVRLGLRLMVDEGHSLLPMWAT